MALSELRGIPISEYWKNIGWQAAGNSLAQLVGILGIPLLSRIYSPADFGVQTLFVQVSVFAAGIITLRYEYFIQLPKDDIEANALSHLVITLGILTTIIMTPFAWIWRNQFASLIGNIELAAWIVWVPITSLLISIAILLQHQIQRLKDYRTSGFSELVGKTSYIGSGLFGILFTKEPIGLIAAPAFSALGKILWITKLSKVRYFNKNTTNTFNWNYFSVKDIVNIALQYRSLSNAMVVSHIFSTLTGLIPIIAFAHLYGTNILGQYALVMSTVYLPSGLIGSAIGQVYYQCAASDWAAKRSIAKHWSRTASKLIMIGAPIFITIAVLSPYAYPFLFGEAWRLAGEIAPIISIAAFFSFISSPMDRTCLILGIWWYPIFWHTLRVSSTALVIFLTWRLNLSFNIALAILVCLQCVLYIIDYMSEWRFSKR